MKLRAFVVSYYSLVLHFNPSLSVSHELLIPDTSQLSSSNSFDRYLPMWVFGFFLSRLLHTLLKLLRRPPLRIGVNLCHFIEQIFELLWAYNPFIWHPPIFPGLNCLISFPFQLFVKFIILMQLFELFRQRHIDFECPCLFLLFLFFWFVTLALSLHLLLSFFHEFFSFRIRHLFGV